jgi:hypothetical protein
MENKTLGLADPHWVAKYDGDHYGFGILDAENATYLSFRYFASKDGSVLDEVHLHKKH